MAIGELFEYFQQLIATRRVEPKNDMLSVLTTAEIDGAKLSDDDLLNLAFLTLAAVFVTRARRIVEPEKYFGADEVSLLLTKNAAVLLRECGEFLAPYLAAAKLTGEVRKDVDVAAAGEWFARVLFSLFGTPSATLNMDADEVVADFVRSHVVRGFANDRHRRSR